MTVLSGYWSIYVEVEQKPNGNFLRNSCTWRDYQSGCLNEGDGNVTTTSAMCSITRYVTCLSSWNYPWFSWTVFPSCNLCPTPTPTLLQSFLQSLLFLILISSSNSQIFPSCNLCPTPTPTLLQSFLQSLLLLILMVSSISQIENELSTGLLL